MKKFITTLTFVSSSFFCLKGVIFGGGAWYKPGTNRNIMLLHDVHCELDLVANQRHNVEAVEAALKNTNKQIKHLGNYARKNKAHIYAEDNPVDMTLRINNQFMRIPDMKSPMFFKDVCDKYNVNVTNIDNRQPSDQQQLLRRSSHIKTSESLREHIGINSILSDGCVPDHEVTDSLNLERVKQRLCAWLALDKKRYNLFKTFYNQNSQDRPLKKAGELNPTCSVEEKMALELLKNEQNGTKNKAIMIAGAEHAHNFTKFLTLAGYKPDSNYYRIIPKSNTQIIPAYTDKAFKSFDTQYFDIKSFLEQKPYTLSTAFQRKYFADEEVKVSKQQKPLQTPPFGINAY